MSSHLGRRWLSSNPAVTGSWRRFHLGNIHNAVPDAPSPAEIAPLLEEYAKHSPRPLTLSKLFSLGQPLTEGSLLESASYVLSEVPRLFGSRVRNLEALPFIVGMNPFIARILAAHRKSFKEMAMFPPVTSLDGNTQVTAQLEALVQAHANDIPTMAKGYASSPDLRLPIKLISSFQFPRVFEVHELRRDLGVSRLCHTESDSCQTHRRTTHCAVSRSSQRRRNAQRVHRSHPLGMLSSEHDQNVRILCQRVVRGDLRRSARTQNRRRR